MQVLTPDETIDEMSESLGDGDDAIRVFQFGKDAKYQTQMW
jgi:hypothetical protein